MNISDVNSIAEKFGRYILDRGIVGGEGEFGALYTNGSVPSSGLPESFLEITGNGPLSTNYSQGGVSDYSLMLISYVRLMPDGSVNTIRETHLLRTLENWLNGTVSLGEYHYTKDKKMMVYSGRNLLSGYSTKIVNINVKIY